nr:PREDICTED: protein shisa-1-like [Struthio camelus australis]
MLPAQAKVTGSICNNSDVQYCLGLVFREPELLQFCLTSSEAIGTRALLKIRPIVYEQSKAIKLNNHSEVPVYLPFLLVGSVFVAFVVGGIFVGICCCKCLKSQGEEQQRGLAPGQTWLLEPDLPSRLPSSSCATRSSLGSSPQMSNTCMNPSPSLPVIRFTEDALFLNAPPTSSRFLHPSHTGHGIPADHTALTPASFLKRTVYGHSANASTISAAHGDQKMYLGVSCLRR